MQGGRGCIATVLAVFVCGCRDLPQPRIADSAAMPIGTTVEGVYSDVAYSEESGDVYGVEIIIRRTGEGYVASFRQSEGVPGRRVTVPLAVQGEEIRFTIPPDTGVLVEGGVGRPAEVDPLRSFTGRVTPWGLKGSVEDWVDSLRLPRRAKPYFPDSATAG